MTYFNAAQHAKLLEPINPGRVGKDGKNFSHVEAYEIRAHLNRILGFARWSADLTDLSPIHETESQGKWTVLYRATVRLAVCAPDGTLLATYTEAATGEAKNQPHRGDAHDLAIKTAESQAMKRCAANLGDQFGLSLYKKGSTAGLVRLSLVPAADSAPPTVDPVSVDAHVTESVPESEQADDKRETSTPPAPPTPVAVDNANDRAKALAAIRSEALDTTLAADEIATFFARLQLSASRGRLLKMLTQDRDGNEVTLGVLLQQEQTRRRSAAA